jgi:alkylation response protein AidB-like acyl-CoA dehydrogenase
VDFRDTPQEAAFRAGVREWLAANLPDGWGTPSWKEPESLHDLVAFHRDWSRRLHAAGYVGLTWPKRYGGRERPIELQAIVLEELGRAEAPEHIGLIGIGMAGPTNHGPRNGGAEGAVPGEHPVR